MTRPTISEPSDASDSVTPRQAPEPYEPVIGGQAEEGEQAESRRRPLKWLLERTYRFAPALTPHVARLTVRASYSVVNRQLRRRPWTCLNYGWATLDGDGIAADSRLSPQEARAGDRLCLQLYERVAQHHVEGKRVLEVGCGRGGGTAFLRRSLGARDVTGVDLTASSIRWCKKHCSEPDVRFAVGDAENLELADSCFDAVVNVESSHNYPHVDRFLAEAHRVLRPGGLLLLADFRPTPDIAGLAQKIAAAGFVVDEDVDITDNVVRSLSLVSAEREAWVQECIPGFLQGAARDFSGTEGSVSFLALAQKEWEYRRYVARKT